MFLESCASLFPSARVLNLFIESCASLFSSTLFILQLLSRHSELEQSETKAQAALITVLSLTQITELKLLLDIGRQGHRFYDFVLAMLIGCISLELFIGIIIIYIGNLHYYQTADRVGFCYQMVSCLMCCGNRGNAAYSRAASKRTPYVGSRQSTRLSSRPDSGGLHQEDIELGVGCCRLASETRLEALVDLERADCNIELARIRVADGNVKIARAANYIKLVEDALKKTPGNAEMEAELQRARDEHAGAIREKEEAEAEQKLAEAQQSHAFFMKEQDEDRQERLTFRKVSFWQHMATYLLYFVMLLNVFITTFGISTGVSHHDNPNILPPTTMANFGYHASHAHSIVSPGIVQNHSTNGR